MLLYIKLSLSGSSTISFNTDTKASNTEGNLKHNHGYEHMFVIIECFSDSHSANLSSC